MALTKISRSLLDTGISDSSDATAITIDSSENVLLNNTTSLIGVNTSDGSDNKSVMINGGGAASDSRGAYVWVKGNEHSDTGSLQLNAGNVSGAAIKFNTSGSERMRITSGGTVLVGKTALDNSTAGIRLNASGQATLARNGSLLYLNRNTTNGDLIEFAKDNSLVGTIGIDSTSLTFDTDGSERMRIDSSGRLLIGLTATQNYENASGRTNDALQVKGAEGINAKSTANGGGCFVALGDSGNTAGSHFIAVDSSGNIDFRVYNSNGNVVNTNGVYSTVSSDRRTKENITDATGKLEDLCRLNVKNFTYKDYPNNGKQIGFMADEMESVFPNLVTQEDTRVYDDDGNLVKGYEDQKSVKVGGPVFAILTKAIQEQQVQIEALQSEINTLKGE